MKAVLKSGAVVELTGANIKEITVSITDDVICIVLYDGQVLLAKSLTVREK